MSYFDDSMPYPIGENYMPVKKCKHCGGRIAIRNPKGFCDHLYYPDNCKVCMKAK